MTTAAKHKKEEHEDTLGVTNPTTHVGTTVTGGSTKSQTQPLNMQEKQHLQQGQQAKPQSKHHKQPTPSIYQAIYEKHGKKRSNNWKTETLANLL